MNREEDFITLWEDGGPTLYHDFLKFTIKTIPIESRKMAQW